MKDKIYTKKDYNSNNGMMTTIWGPILWQFLHIMSFNYPINPTDKNKKEYKKFIESLQNILPCKKCRDNLKKNLKDFPLTTKHLKNRLTFSKYIYELHERINKLLGKKSNLTYEMVRERYEHFRSKCINTRKNNEKGCLTPFYGIKSKSVVRIVPQTKKCNSFQMNKKCIIKRLDKITKVC